MTQREILAQTVRDLRARIGLTQSEIAARCSFNREWLSAIEQARIKEPDREWLSELAVALGVDPAVLLKAAGYRVDRVDGPPKVKPRSLADILQEAAIRARELAEDNGPEAKAQYRQFASLFAHVIPELVGRR